MEFKFKPIVKWPRTPTTSRSRSRFDSSYRDTLELLERELRQVGARQPVIIQTYMAEYDIRNDGLPRSDARTPSNPGVIVTFEKLLPTGNRDGNGRMIGKWTSFSFPCDQFIDWKNNLRAIALAMEALRKIDRYGVTQNAEQYTGWKALPASGGLQTDEEAARTLISKSGLIANIADVLASPDIAKKIYRAACNLTHPDKPSGNIEDFKAVQVAWERLKERHKLS